MAGEESVGGDYDGERVCLSKWTTNGVSCGYISQRSVDVTDAGGVKWTVMREADFECQPGDSGGPVYQILTNAGGDVAWAAGLMHGYVGSTSPSTECIYSHIQDVLYSAGMAHVVGY